MCVKRKEYSEGGRGKSCRLHSPPAAIPADRPSLSSEWSVIVKLTTSPRPNARSGYNWHATPIFKMVSAQSSLPAPMVVKGKDMGAREGGEDA
jgi:hypothetical protein